MALDWECDRMARVPSVHNRGSVKILKPFLPQITDFYSFLCQYPEMRQLIHGFDARMKRFLRQTLIAANKTFTLQPDLRITSVSEVLTHIKYIL